MVITMIIITVLVEIRLNLEESRQGLDTGYCHQVRELENILGQTELMLITLTQIVFQIMIL